MAQRCKPPQSQTLGKQAREQESPHHDPLLMTGRRGRNAKPETGDPATQEGDQAEEGEVDETVPMDESDETSHPTISDTQCSVDAKKVGVIRRLTCRNENRGYRREPWLETSLHPFTIFYLLLANKWNLP